MATLTVKVIEEITLNNNSYNSERSLDISSVNEIVKRIVTISAGKERNVPRGIFLGFFEIAALENFLITHIPLVIIVIF